MSRQTDGRKVWYEWLVEAFVINEAKKRIRLGMSDVGSNRIPGYVM
jgi:protein arginine N-methyltransferase 5